MADLPQVSDLIGNDVTEGQFKTAIAQMLMFMSDGGGVPSGFIGMWSGSSDAIPDGWALCDGNNGTPDLRNRFIIGAGSDYAVGSTGGSASGVTGAASGDTGAASGNTGATTLDTSKIPSHSHKYVAEAIYRLYSTSKNDNTFYATLYNEDTDTGATGGGRSHTHTLNSHTHTLNSHTHTVSLPPFYALCFIMKL